MKAKAISLLAFLALASVGVSSPSNAHAPGKLTPYTMALKVVDYKPNGESKEAYSEVRYVSARGRWRSVKSLPNGRSLEQYAQIGRGVFTIDKARKKMYFESPYTGEQKNLQNAGEHPGYVRMESVLGFACYVFRTQVDGGFAEVFRAPALNGDVIKSIIKRGSNTRVIQPIFINLGEPPLRTLNHGEYEIDNSRDKRSRVRHRQ